VTLRPDFGPWPPLRDLTITLRYTTLDRTPLDEWSAQTNDLYLTEHTTYTRQTLMTLAWFELAVPVGERPQAHALESAITMLGKIVINAFYDSSLVWPGNFQDNKLLEVIIPSFHVRIHLFVRFKFNILFKIWGFVARTYKVTISWKSKPKCLTERKQCLCWANCRTEGLSILKREAAYPSDILVNMYKISELYVPENINSNI
jgi:hypothetical protein